jgi:rhodanese-related sulfurtransferase
MEELIRKVVPHEINDMKVEIEEFIELYNERKCELIDVRVPFETAVWKMNFGLFIPANELPDNLDKLPKDKLLVVACPKTTRSIMARMYLAEKGFHVKFLSGGLTGLTEFLKGGKAKMITL